MGQESIRFHIMVPVYKVERYLDECVESVLNQTYSNFELILVDDGSPDRCGQMCDAWAEKDERIRAFHKPNGGLMHTRRFAIARIFETEVGEQDFGVFLDSDDTLHPETLETIASAVEQYRCDCVMYRMNRIVDGIVQESAPWGQAVWVVSDKRQIYRRVLETDSSEFNSLCCKAVRMDALKGEDFTAYHHIAIGEDRLQSLQIYRNCRNFCLIDQGLYNYRVNPTGMTCSQQAMNCDVFFPVFEAEAAYLRADPDYTEADLAAYRSIRIHCLTGDLVRIAQQTASRKEKRRVYDRIRSSAYWKEFLDGGNYDRRELGKMSVVYEAFRKGNDDVIFLLAAGYKLLRGRE